MSVLPLSPPPVVARGAHDVLPSSCTRAALPPRASAAAMAARRLRLSCGAVPAAMTGDGASTVPAGSAAAATTSSSGAAVTGAATTATVPQATVGVPAAIASAFARLVAMAVAAAAAAAAAAVVAVVAVPA